MRGLLLVCVGLFAASGCFHHQTVLPGVIDMRTDGSGLPGPARSAAPERKVARGGAEAIAEGAGLAVAGRDVTIEDRHYWILGSIPIYNESPTPELEAARNVGGALTHLSVGEELGPIDILAAIGVPIILPVASWVLPPYTFRAYGRTAAWRAAPESPQTAPTPPEPAP